MNPKATKRERELVAALRQYGVHALKCLWEGMPWMDGHQCDRCTCGLAAAIRGGAREG